MRRTGLPLKTLISAALAEDLGAGDITSEALIPVSLRAKAQVVAKAPGVVAGTALAAGVFRHVSSAVRCTRHLRDGQWVAPGQAILTLRGPARALLAGERTALNGLQHLSGVATLTARYVERVRGTRAAILDTRKTLPGWRALQKQAVADGGGTNHRMGLDDAILIKTNHLRLIGSPVTGRAVAEAVRRAKERAPRKSVEIEVRTMAELRAALEAGADVIMLDNWPLRSLRQAVTLRGALRPATLLEVSGGVTLESVGAIARTGVDRISVGRLTHSAPSLDMALRIVSA